MIEETKYQLYSASSPVVEPELEDNPTDINDSGWKVTVYNNETNTYHEVIAILMIATRCDFEEAHIETWEIDHYGSCVVHRAKQEDCEQAAKIIAKIGIAVEAEPDEGL